MTNEEKVNKIANNHCDKCAFICGEKVKLNCPTKLLMEYTLWLDMKGFFAEDLQCDFGHQIDTFLEMNKNE